MANDLKFRQGTLSSVHNKGGYLIISYERNFIFIKGVKVAGTSIESHLSQVLEESAVVAPLPGDNRETRFPHHRSRNYLRSDGRNCFYDHMRATEVRSLIGTEQYERMYKFGVIRNPFQKVLSLLYMRRDYQGQTYSLDDAIAECESEQIRLCDGDSLIVHRAIIYERLNHELSEVFTLLGVQFSGTLQYRDRSEHRPRQECSTPKFSHQQITAVETKFAFELELYRKAGFLIGGPDSGPN